MLHGNVWAFYILSEENELWHLSKTGWSIKTLSVYKGKGKREREKRESHLVTYESGTAKTQVDYNLLVRNGTASF